jgi:PAS domain S-box-containing protein
MDRSIISACKALDSFGLPRAVGNISTDRLIAANNSFLRLVGFEKSEIFEIPLSEIVTMRGDSPESARTGRLIPIIIQSAKENQAIGGHAAIRDDDLVFLMVYRFVDPSPDFEAGAVIGKERERQSVASYVHENLAPELMSAVYALESIRAQLEKEHHPSASKLKEIQDLVTEPLQRMAAELKKRVIEQRELNFTARRLAAIVEDSDDAIISKDLNGIVLSWNQGAERMFGYSPEEMIGTSITRIIPPEGQEEEAQILACLRRGERYNHFETVRVTKDGRQLWVSLTVSPIKDETGRLIGASKIARDITDRKKQQAALQ